MCDQGQHTDTKSGAKYQHYESQFCLLLALESDLQHLVDVALNQSTCSLIGRGAKEMSTLRAE